MTDYHGVIRVDFDCENDPLVPEVRRLTPGRFAGRGGSVQLVEMGTQLHGLGSLEIRGKIVLEKRREKREMLSRKMRHVFKLLIFDSGEILMGLGLHGQLCSTTLAFGIEGIGFRSSAGRW